ncbi:MAG: flagellar M-ring protein FliF [Acidobacteriota bacterium]|nr:flagellar M-ring protein FliF [Acidobacteriota bacterium]
MPLDTSQLLLQGKTVIRGLSGRQKALIAASLIAVAGTLWLFVSLLGRGDYRVLYSGLDPAESNTIVKRLADENIPAQLSADGKTLSVPAGRLDKARLDMAAQGFPHTGRLGFEIFDRQNWGESDFDEKVNYQRALEGELERTIQDLTDVEAVSVHLVLPHESLFTDQERQAKASVMVKLRNGRLSERSLKAITYLVASSVDTLTPDNVTVVDADGNVPIVMRGGVKPGSPEGAADFEQALDQKLEATLTPILGANHFVAKATVEYDPESNEKTQETYDPKDTVVLTSQVTTNGGDGGGDAGIPGAASNVPPGQSNANNPNNPNTTPNPNNSSTQNNAGASGAGNGATGANGSGAASSASADNNSNASANDGSGDEGEGSATSDSKTYGVGKTVLRTIRPPGAIKRISAAIIVDDALETKLAGKKTTTVSEPRTPAEIKQIQALASAVLGLDPSRGDFVTVENIPFTITPMTEAKPLSGLKRIAPFLNQYGYLVRYIILGVLGLLILLFVLRPLIKQLGAMQPALPTPNPLQPALAAASEAPAPLDAATTGLPAGPPPPEMSSEKQKFTTMREALVTKVNKTPAEAGRLVEGWLHEEED